jgi:hypothetical protein
MAYGQLIPPDVLAALQVAVREAQAERRRDRRQNPTIALFEPNADDLPTGAASAGPTGAAVLPTGAASAGPSVNPGPKPSPYSVLVNGVWRDANGSGWEIKNCPDDKPWEPPDSTTGGRQDLGACLGWHTEGEGSPLVLAFLALALLAAPWLIAYGIDSLTRNPFAVNRGDFPDVGEDRIEIRRRNPRVPGQTQIDLEATPGMWLKSLDFRFGVTNASGGVISTKGTKTKTFLRMPDGFLDLPYGRIILGKAKLLGILTQMYALPTAGMAGSDWQFRWTQD